MTPGRWEQLKWIYNEAAARPAAERASFLDQACAGDAELRAEVERMLSCASGSGGFLESPAVEVAARALAEGAGGLSPGSHLGPYEIVSLAGVGGMGQVWKARDTRLRRLVALKILPREFTADPERKRRLVREARAASALNHPNIVTVHDIGQVEGIDYIAMEYVEGKTLDKHIAHHKLKLGEALRLAVQIADALARAHAVGIVHRDLKPGNVMVTADGRAKLLDFGLAKLSETATDALATSAGQPATRPGMVMGTPQYMAPEQIEGKPADQRTDIFAFGCVLYEMLAGKRAFEAESGVSLMAAILKEEPHAVVGAPPALERLLKKCLAKDPDRRWQSAADLRDELEWIASEEASAAQRPAPRRVRTVIAATALCALFASAVWIGNKWMNQSAAPQVYEFTVPPPRGEFYVEFSSIGQISPDGRMIATISRMPGRAASVWLRRCESGILTQLPGTEGVRKLTWSPDSRQLAILKGGKLLKIPIEGGVPQVIAEGNDTGAGWPFAWGSGGYLVTTDPNSHRLMSISENGGKSRLLGELDQSRGEISHGQPQFLPDGKRYLYFAMSSSADRSGIYADSIDATPGKPTRVHILASPSASVLALLPGRRPFLRSRAYLLTCRDNTLFAHRFDLEKLRIEGEPMPLASQVSWERFSVGVSASRNGTLVLAPLLREETEAAVFDREGKELDHTFLEGRYYNPAFSHDGNKIVISRTEPVGTQQDIWIYDLVRSSWSRFTPGSSPWHGFGVWRHDDRELVYAATGPNSETRLLYRKDVDGLRGPEKILGPTVYPSPYDWSLDGRYLIYGVHRTTRPVGFDLWILPMQGGGNPYPFLESEHNARFASFSPDGRFVAFSWNPSAEDEVYVRPFDRARTRQWRVTAGGGTQPRWSKDGKQIYFLGAGKKLMSVAVKTQGDEFVAGTPAEIMPLPRLPYTFSGYLYDVAPRGDHVVFIRVNADLGNPPLRVILNWEGLLKQ
jgi:serine/threonine protein kinase/Tol biopolymer transport system component